MRQVARSSQGAGLWVVVLLAAAACGTASLPEPRTGVVLPVGRDAAVLRVLEAAATCDFQVALAEADASGGRAMLVLLEQWRQPQPESAVLLVVVQERGASSEVQVTARSLADYGRQAPAFDGHGFPSCACCEAAAAGFDMAVFSPSRALAAGSRARACLVKELSR